MSCRSCGSWSGLGELLARIQQPEPADRSPRYFFIFVLRVFRVDGASPRVVDHRIQSMTRVFDWGLTVERICSKKFPGENCPHSR